MRRSEPASSTAQHQSDTASACDRPSGAVRQNFGVRAPGRDWAVAGLSEGGSCSIMLALRHPDLFGTFGDYGGLAGPRLGDTNDDTAGTLSDLFGGSQEAFDAHEPSVLLREPTPAMRGLGAWFEVGSGDPEPLAAIQQLAPLTEQAGITTCVMVVARGGAHVRRVERARSGRRCRGWRRGSGSCRTARR